MKAQIYLMIAVFIAIIIAGVINIQVNDYIAVQTSQSRTSNLASIVYNFNKEISVMELKNFSSSEINDFISIYKNYTAEKNYNLSVTIIE